MLCGMLHEARVGISENVASGHKETGLNYSGETGCACQKPEMFICSETLNLPGGAAPGHPGGSWGWLPLSLHNIFKNEYETLE